MENKIKYMRIALSEALAAAEIGEVPVGAVIVKDDLIIAKAHNMVETYNLSSAHAEMLAIRQAEKKLGNKWLNNCDLYVTLEPCSMCAGAMILSRIKNLYIGAMDSKNGAAGSVFNITNEQRLNHNINVEVGILEEECGKILTDFFKDLRIAKAQSMKKRNNVKNHKKIL